MNCPTDPINECFKACNEAAKARTKQCRELNKEHVKTMKAMGCKGTTCSVKTQTKTCKKKTVSSKKKTVCKKPKPKVCKNKPIKKQKKQKHKYPRGCATKPTRHQGTCGERPFWACLDCLGDALYSERKTGPFQNKDVFRH